MGISYIAKLHYGIDLDDEFVSGEWNPGLVTWKDELQQAHPEFWDEDEECMAEERISDVLERDYGCTMHPHGSSFEDGGYKYLLVIANVEHESYMEFTKEIKASDLEVDEEWESLILRAINFLGIKMKHRKPSWLLSVWEC